MVNRFFSYFLNSNTDNKKTVVTSSGELSRLPKELFPQIIKNVNDRKTLDALKMTSPFFNSFLSKQERKIYITVRFERECLGNIFENSSILLDKADNNSLYSSPCDVHTDFFKAKAWLLTLKKDSGCFGILEVVGVPNQMIKSDGKEGHIIDENYSIKKTDFSRFYFIYEIVAFNQQSRNAIYTNPNCKKIKPELNLNRYKSIM